MSVDSFNHVSNSGTVTAAADTVTWGTAQQNSARRAEYLKNVQNILLQLTLNANRSEGRLRFSAGQNSQRQTVAQQRATLGLAFVFFNIRTKDVKTASALSGMAQSLGYLLAAVGPFAFDMIFDIAHSWTPAIYLLLVLTIGLIIVGWFASMDRKIE